MGPYFFGHSVIDPVYKLKLQEPRRDFVTKAIQSEKMEEKINVKKVFFKVGEKLGLEGAKGK